MADGTCFREGGPGSETVGLHVGMVEKEALGEAVLRCRLVCVGRLCIGRANGQWLPHE